MSYTRRELLEMLADGVAQERKLYQRIAELESKVEKLRHEVTAERNNATYYQDMVMQAVRDATDDDLNKIPG